MKSEYTTGKSKASIEVSYKGAIYTGEFNKTIRSYSCKGCCEITKGGVSEKYITIEELKEKGCYQCGRQTFELVDKSRV